MPDRAREPRPDYEPLEYDELEELAAEVIAARTARDNDFDTRLADLLRRLDELEKRVGALGKGAR